MMPKISVIIPVYNGVPFLNKAIDSVLCQDYPAHEIIVVDDGSTDGSPAVLDSYGSKVKRKRIPNSGISEARNAGMAMVTGDYIAFLDQDDVWFKNKLAKQVEAIRRYPEIGFFSSNYVTRSSYDRRLRNHFSGMKRLKELNFDEPLHRDIFKLLLEENFIGTPSAFMLSRKLAEQVGKFSPRYLYTQDHDYQLRCARFTNFFISSDILLYKRTHPGNFSAHETELTQENIKLFVDTGLAHSVYIRERRLESVHQKAMSKMYFVLGDQFFKRGKRRDTFKAYFKGFSSAPSLFTLVWFCFKSLRKFVRILISLFYKKKLS